MPILRIATRYAKSWFELAQEANELKKAYEDVRAIRKMCDVDDFSDFLKSPIIDKHKKTEVLEKLLAGKACSVTLKTIKVIMEHGRGLYLRDICRSFRTLYYEVCHISRARLITAAPITDTTAQNLVVEFQKSGMLQPEVELERIVKPEIVGGFILEFNNQVYNASIAFQLEQLNIKFSKNLYTKNL
jgi:F-type H+-transporting ATPase subunit delta